MTYLHVYALSGQGRITDETAAHLKVRHQPSEEHVPRPNPTARGVSQPALPCPGSIDSDSNKSFSPAETNSKSDVYQNISDAKTKSSDLEDEDKDNGDDNIYTALGGHAVTAAQSLLSQDHLTVASGLQAPPPGLKPLALNTTVKQFKDILRQLGIYKVQLDVNLCNNVLQIVRHLAHQRGFYPTATLRKTWISADTITLLQAAIWNVLGHKRSSNGTRSVHNLLSIHALIILLDQLGGRVSTWLDLDNCKATKPGQYLRWSMVKIYLCGYSEHGPDFIVIVDSNSSKHAAWLGNLKFHHNTAASCHKLRSQSLPFVFVVLAICQGVMEPALLQTFDNSNFGKKLLALTTKKSFECSLCSDHVNAPVFVHDRVELQHCNVDGPPQKPSHRECQLDQSAAGPHH